MKSFYQISLRNYSKKTVEDIRAKVHKNNINTITMGFSNLYGCFVGKKYDSDYFVDKAIKNGSNACNYLLSCDLGFNPLPNARISSYERGFGDFTMKADLDSCREINYINNSKQLLFFSDLFENEKDNAIQHNPRYLLRNSVNEINKLGLYPKLQCEINFNIFYDNFKKNEKIIDKMKPLTEHANLHNCLYKNNFENFFKKIKNSMKVSGIGYEGIKGDEAQGQYRIMISATDPIEFCDNIVLLKLILKKLADDEDKTLSFMAKLCSQKGNSANIKISLKDQSGNNILNDIDYTQEKGVVLGNTLGEQAIAGIEKHLTDFLIFYAPTVNSYKRFREPDILNNWNKLGFMQENCGLNIIQETGENKLFFKLPGADVNPYLSAFSLLASMKSGIVNKTNLKDALGEISIKALPLNLNKSVSLYEKNDFMREVLGEEIHFHYGAFYNFEFSEYMNQVDDWERNRYLYQI